MAALTRALTAVALVWATRGAAHPVDRWSAEITEASARFGLPAAWIRQVIRVESGGQTMQGGQPIVSSAGAMGLMQVMPITWREMRLALGLGADPQQPRDNILAGTAYLRLMYDRFGYPGLFGAYNAGPGRYASHLAGKRRLPAETRTYMRAVAEAGRANPANRSPSSGALFAVRAGGPAATSARTPESLSAALFVALGEDR